MRFVLGYIDPSSGSMILQMIVGGAMAAVYGGRRVIAHTAQSAWQKVRRKQAPSSGTEASENNPDKQA
jgi:hypothetical protein